MVHRGTLALAAGMLCMVLSLGVMGYTLYALAELAQEQREFEKAVTTVLISYTSIMSSVVARQTYTENIVMEGQQLHLTLNEIKQYNRKRALQYQKNKNISIGGP